MANQYGINLGDIYRTVESVKGARTANKLNQLRLDEAQAIADQRPAMMKRQENILNLRKEAAGGSEAAMRQLIFLDPENMPQTLDAIYKMDDRGRDKAKRGVEQLGQIAATVLQQPTPEAQAQTYQRLYASMPPEMKQRFPDQYDQGFMELSLAKATSMETYLENPVKVEVGSEDVLYKSGREVDRAPTPVDPSKAGVGSGTGSLKSADESLMFRQTVEALGGVFDAQGNITALDPEVRPKIQGIAAEAARIYMAERNISRSEAVKRALQKFNVQVPNVPMQDPTDPASIRNFLLNQ